MLAALWLLPVIDWSNVMYAFAGVSQLCMADIHTNTDRQFVNKLVCRFAGGPNASSNSCVLGRSKKITTINTHRNMCRIRVPLALQEEAD